MKKEKVKINVFLTKSLKFRALIEEPGQYAYEVTIGGEVWRDGKGRKYEDEIFSRMGRIVSEVHREFHLLTTENFLIIASKFVDSNKDWFRKYIKIRKNNGNKV